MILNASSKDPTKLPGRIQILNRQRRYRIYRKPVAAFCAALLHALGRPAGTLSVVFTGAREMRRLNRRYLRRDYATDVLSFCYKGVGMEGLPFLGEIILAPEIAVRQAARYRVDPERELRRLLVHGVLHVLGYDHETDKGRMQRAQAKLMRRKFFKDSAALADLKARR